MVGGQLAGYIEKGQNMKRRSECEISVKVCSSSLTIKRIGQLGTMTGILVSSPSKTLDPRVIARDSTVAGVCTDE